MLFESFSKGPSGLSYIFLIKCKVPTLEPVDDLTFVFHGFLVLRVNQEVFNCAITFEVGLYAMPTTYLFDASACTLGVGYDYMTLCCDFIGGGLGAIGAMVVSLITSYTGGLSKPSFHPIKGPFGALKVSECFPEVLHFCLEKLRFIANYFCPVSSVLIALYMTDR